MEHPTRPTDHTNDERESPRLVTDRLVLRTWTEADEAPMLAMSTDPEVMRHFPSVMTPEQVHALVLRHAENHAHGRPGLFVVESREDGSFLGFVGLARPPWQAHVTPCVEIGWRLVRSAWGRGVATEAARASLRHGFEVLRLEGVVSFTSLPNVGSQAVMRRLGMRLDGEFDHPLVPEGSPLRRHVLYRLSAERWRSRRSRGPG